MSTLALKTCPVCGSNRIKRVQRTLKRTYNGEPYSVPSVTFHTCPTCGENFFSPAAIDKIQSYSPAFAKHAAKKIRRAG